MVYKRFSLIITFRIILICLSVFLLAYVTTDTSLYATIFILSIIIIIQIYSLIKFVEKTNKDISRFFDSIRYSDFTQSFRSNIKGAAFDELSDSFMEVIDEFKKTRKEKEENYRYLQTIVQHISIGILAYTPEGNVELLNNAAKKLLKINSLRNISDLNSLSKSLVSSLFKIRTGDKILEKVIDNNELLQLSIFAAEFKLGAKHIILVSLNNIQSELEEKEMEAWQNLIRVLTHEIMNSITPIISLSSTVNNILENTGEQITAETINDVRDAITTILKRSNGLIHFVDSYRSLTRIPSPNFSIIKLDVLFDRLKKLLNEECIKRGIKFSYNIDPSNLELTADQDLIEQVLINLITNSINAVSNSAEPCIQLIGKFDNRGVLNIQVIDNGKGIPVDLQEKIFIPFFTTKKEGSGIGLSLSRQIMRIHKGSISVNSIPDKETVFTLRF